VVYLWLSDLGLRAAQGMLRPALDYRN
jgi:hypothetical protein